MRTIIPTPMSTSVVCGRLVGLRELLITVLIGVAAKG